PSALGVGVVVWLASELMFFAGLFAAYFTLRSVNDVWPPAGVELETARTAVATAVLVGSSGAMHMAVTAAKREDRQGATRWLGVTALMGLLFLSNQLLEYVQADFRLDDHAYGSVFYLMTGFHGAHVIGGLIFMGAGAAALLGRAAPAGTSPPLPLLLVGVPLLVSAVVTPVAVAAGQPPPGGDEVGRELYLT